MGRLSTTECTYLPTYPTLPLMNLPELIWASATASCLPTPDEIDLATLMRARRHRHRVTDPDVGRQRMIACDHEAFGTVWVVQDALWGGGVRRHVSG